MAGRLALWCRLWVAAGTIAGLAACAGGSAGPDVAHQEHVAQDPAAMIRIADAAEASGDLSSAEAFYRRAAELKPDLIAAQIGTARALAEEGDLDQAADVLRAAHARDPHDPEITITLGRLLVAAKRPAEAVPVFEDGLTGDPKSVALLVGKGVALDKSGRHAEAQLAYEAALLVKPDDAAAKKNLALSKALADSRDPAGRGRGATATRAVTVN